MENRKMLALALGAIYVGLQRWDGGSGSDSTIQEQGGLLVFSSYRQWIFAVTHPTENRQTATAKILNQDPTI